MSKITTYRNLLQYLNNTRNTDKSESEGLRWVKYGFELGNGLVIEVQASEFHYCYPRRTSYDYSIYDSFEVVVKGNLKKVPEWLSVMDDSFDVKSDKHTFMNVPVDEVIELIEECDNIINIIR